MMSRFETWVSGWRGVCLVTVTYVYFLIFAQFAFLRRLAELGIAEAHLTMVMAAMATGGVLSSVWSGRLVSIWKPGLRLQIALCGCGVAALCTLLRLDFAEAVAVSFLVGAALGMLTVGLVSNLGLWLGSERALLKVGFGTGLGYLLCNDPALFMAAPRTQAITAAALCALGFLTASRQTSSRKMPTEPHRKVRAPHFGLVLISFTALVWLDSAAFFIIQNTPSLKAGTWEGTLHLWANGLLHFGAAILGALLLRRQGLSFVLGGAALTLACSCLLLDGGRAGIASVFYPIGVSLYSVALVAYPSLLMSHTSPAQQGWRAGWIYAVAGWFGSAMGIGMGQHLGSVPLLFIALAVSVVLGPQLLTFLRPHRHEAGVVSAVLLVAFGVHRAVRSPAATQAATSAVERGRDTYIAEGCIHCHSQYVRPNTADVLLWGPTKSITELRAQHPPLIGNRRQGPDLSQVGGRRSRLWLKAHFYDPRQVSRASFMPSYAYLFEGSSRGDDLVAYLSSLKSAEYSQHVEMEREWRPKVPSETRHEEGAALFAQHCSTCHEQTGQTRMRWVKSFKRLPPNLLTGPWMWLRVSDTAQSRELDLSRVIKFGIQDTDMPGHEYLSDQDVTSIARWVNWSMAQPERAALKRTNRGEN